MLIDFFIARNMRRFFIIMAYFYYDIYVKLIIYSFGKFSNILKDNDYNVNKYKYQDNNCNKVNELNYNNIDSNNKLG